MWDNVNFRRLVIDLLPTFLRRSIVVGLINSMMAPVRSIYDDWFKMRKEHLYILEHNWQVCYMRGALNDKFDPSLRRIYIDGTGGDAMKTYIYTPVENQTKYLGTIYLYNSLEFADTGADFLVFVPAAIVAAQPFELRAQIELYRMGGKRYLIIEI